MDIPLPSTMLPSGQDPQARARSACLILRSHYHSTSRLRQPHRPQCNKATTWEPHQHPRNQSAREGPTLGRRSPVRAPVQEETAGPHGAESQTVADWEPLALLAGQLAVLFLFLFLLSFCVMSRPVSSQAEQKSVIGGRVQYTPAAHEPHT